MHTLPVALISGDSPFKAVDTQLKCSTGDVGGSIQAVQQEIAVSSTPISSFSKTPSSALQAHRRHQTEVPVTPFYNNVCLNFIIKKMTGWH